MVLSPDGDGIADVAAISYTLTGKAAVTGTVRDAAGAVVATLFSEQRQGARRQSFPFRPDALADGAYTLTISAAGQDGRTGALTGSFSVDRTLSALTLTSGTLTPNGDGSDDAITIGFTLAVPAETIVQIEQAGSVVATLLAGSLPAGGAQFTWDGTATAGPAPDGPYEAVVIVNGPFGETRHAAPLTIKR